jgi:DNA primase catalytic core
MSSPRLGDFLDQEILPRLRAEDVFSSPLHRWKTQGKEWKGSCPWPTGHDNKTGTAFSVNPSTLEWYCSGCRDGGHVVQYLHKLKGGSGKPTGEDFVSLVRELAAMAGVTFPERSYSPEEVEERTRQEGRRSALAVLMDYARETLWSPKGEAARAYLKEKRGLKEEEILELGLGLYHSAHEVEEALRSAGVDAEAVKSSAVTWEKLEGYILFPWADAMGRPLTVYGRAVGAPPEGKPKTIALPGEGTKGSPLYFDRARKAGVSEVVVVEGVLDAAVLQVRGDHRAVASVAARLSDLQIETLRRFKVKRVFICGDPDGGGDKGNADNVKALTAAGLEAFVVPRLPDGQDPDEYVNEHGLEAWRELVKRSLPGAVFQAERILEGVTPESPDLQKQDAALKVADLVETVQGVKAELIAADLFRLTMERTGYPVETLARMAEEIGERHRKEERERQVDEALRKAAAARSRGDLPELVVQDLEKALAAVKVKVVDTPPPFSVARLDAESKRLSPGRLTGWDLLDNPRRLGVTFNAGELIVFAARTGHCKTSAIVNLFANWAKEAKRDELLVFYSEEESELQVYHRLLALFTADYKTREGGRSSWSKEEIRDYLRAGDNSRTDYSWPEVGAVAEARERLHALEDRILIVHRPRWTVEEIDAHVRKVADEREVGAVLVDYLQRTPGPQPLQGTRHERRDIEVSATSRYLKALAEDLAVPLVTGAQINREAIPKNYREDLQKKIGDYEGSLAIIRTGRPELNHLREGGSEQEADKILGLLNYAADVKVEENNRAAIPSVTLLEVGVLKNRGEAAGAWGAFDFEGRPQSIRDEGYF